MGQSQKKHISHLDAAGKPRMVDVSGKLPTRRYAKAQSRLRFPPGILEQILEGKTLKGGIWEPARLAGIQGAKNTAQLIPLCHGLNLDQVKIDFHVVLPDVIEVVCEAYAEAKTGVEMEALTGACLAALTIYDMCKGLHKGICLESTRLLEKTGGKSGRYLAP